MSRDSRPSFSSSSSGKARVCLSAAWWDLRRLPEQLNFPALVLAAIARGLFGPEPGFLRS